MSEVKTVHNDVLIIGGGVTGLAAALSLDALGISSIIVEKTSDLGGKVRGYSKVFPDFRSGVGIVDELVDRIRHSLGILPLIDTEVSAVTRKNDLYSTVMSNGERYIVNAIIVASGFEVFDARKQEEYGYGIYPNVIDALDLESLLKDQNSGDGMLKRPSDGKPVERIAIIFCVGSRNKKLGNPYCSRICCSYSTKQSIELMEKYPDVGVTCFYMDIRTYDRGFEEMFQYAQELGVKYIRGRVSECSSLINGDIQVRAENTLLGKPVQGIFDLVSLSVGMMPCRDAETIASLLNIERSEDGFFTKKDKYFYPHDTSSEGVFLAGSTTGLKPIKDCLMEAISVSSRVAAYINGGRVTR